MKISEKTAKGMKSVLDYDAGRQHRGRVSRVKTGDVNVKVIRDRLNLTQEEFAERFGLSLGTGPALPGGACQHSSPPVLNPA